MAKCPDWFDLKYRGVKDNNLICEIKLNYIPLRFFLVHIKKIVGYRIWLYPKIWRWCLGGIGLVIRP